LKDIDKIEKVNMLSKKIAKQISGGKCLACGADLKPDEEFICDKCFTKEMKADVEALRKEANNDLAEYLEDHDESWRFKDNRGRCVF
jgi:hypothetical protein